ncbi:hypothetical protein LCGC14_1706050 [marine sediment metagenome]|uniref:Cyclin-like domain-containing protein n=1 Tax=marine sediment metagenome TaxID=412755 RepID=A0A0F9JX03_9ZZZZ
MTKCITKENSNSCLECGGFITFSQYQGEEACTQCGLVINERLFSTSNNGKRNIDTVILPSHSSGYIPHYKNNARWNALINETSYQKSLGDGQVHLKRICHNLNLPESVRYNSEYLFTRALRKGLMRGHSICGMACACIFHEAKKGYNRSFKEISQQIVGLVNMPNKEKKHIRKCYSVLFNKLSLDYQPKKMEDLITRYVSEAGLDIKLVPFVIRFLESVRAKNMFNGKIVSGVVAAAIYLNAKEFGECISQKKIAQIASVTDTTVRSRKRELEKLMGINTM